MDSAEVICDPEFDAWDTLLAKNLDWRHSVSSLFDAQQSLRAVVTKCAYQYTRELFDSDLSMHDGPLLLTGHQPRVYHPGILVKNTLLERFAKRHKGLGINVIIDTDTGDGGHFYFPQYTNGQISLGQASFAAPGAETYGAQVVADGPHLDAVADQVSSSLEALGLSYEQETFREVCDLYKQHAGESIVRTNTLVRRHFVSTGNVLELPLSTILREPDVLSVWSSLLRQADYFFEQYNLVLGKFRKTRKIKNPANPFPDLRKSSLGFELPFWVVNSIQGTRQPLFVKLSGSKLTLFAGEELWLEVNRDQLEEALIQVSASSYLAPRAMVITILLRLFVGDFFVHGLGGAKYDACTDEFMKAFYSIDAPEFTTASANQYLLAGERREFLEAKTLYDQKREMYFHPRSFADAGLFSESQLAAIEQYSTQKLEWIEQLKEKKKRGESAAEITQEIKKLERDIGAIVDSSVEAVLGPKVHISAEAQLAILCREYPYFFFL